MKESRKSIRQIAPLAGMMVLSIAALGCNDDTPFEPSGSNFDERHFAWSGVVTAGQEIEIKGLTGDIRATTAAGNEVEVEAELRGRGHDPEGVRIEVVRHPGGVTICAVYPDRAGQPPNSCEPGLSGRLNGGDYDVDVTFAVAVPSGVRFVGRNVTGSVTATGLQSDVDASSVTGDVVIETTELAQATTVTGSVTAYLGGTEWNRDLRFTAVTGDVYVEVPPSARADVVAFVVNGSIVSDFPLTQTAFGRREGKIGGGGPELRLSTVNGNVTLRKGL